MNLMRKTYFYKFVVILFSILNFSIGQCQLSTTIGGITGFCAMDEYPCPIGDYYGGARMQFLYTQQVLSNLPSGVYISNVGFLVDNFYPQVSNHLIENFTIKIANTTLSNFSSGTFQSVAGVIYNTDAYSFNIMQGNNPSFDLPNPLLYTGNGLLIEICFGSSTSENSGNPPVKYFFTSYNGFQIKTFWNQNGCDFTGQPMAPANTNYNRVPWLTLEYYQPCNGIPQIPNTLSDDIIICPLDSIQLSLDNVQSTNYLYYKWQKSIDGIEYSDVSNSYNYNSLIATPSDDCYYRCKIYCPNTGLSSYSNPVQIQVNDIENLNISPTDQTVCLNNIADSLHTSTAYESTYDYQWYLNYSNSNLNGNPIANSQSPSYYATTYVADTLFYYCSILDQTTNCITTSNTSRVIIDQAILSSIPSDKEICRGDSVLFNAEGQNIVDYSWSNNVTNNTYSNELETGVYTVIATNENGCITDANFHITINELPSVYAGQDIITCPNITTVLEASGADNYIWNNGVIQGTPFYPQTSEYIAIGIDQNGCSNSDTLDIHLDSELNPLVSENITGTAYGFDGAIEIEYSTTNPPCIFDWSYDGTGDFDDAQNLTNVNAGDYSLTIVDSLGCTAYYTFNIPLNLNVFIPTAISPNNDGFNDTWQIRGLDQFESYQISVYNTQGVLVYQKANGYTPWNGYYNSEPLVADDYIYVIDTKNPGNRFTGFITITY